MTRKLSTLLLAFCFAIPCLAQNNSNDERMTVPKSMLTKDQIAELEKQHIKDGVSGWAGMGREIGEAVNSSMQAITTQTNNFSQTGVGKLTIALVVWKVIGDQVVHLVFGILELLVFLPLWVWSYRRTCITRSIRIGKEQWKEIVYDGSRYEFSPRIVHGFLILLLLGVVLCTVFSY